MINRNVNCQLAWGDGPGCGPDTVRKWNWVRLAILGGAGCSELWLGSFHEYTGAPEAVFGIAVHQGASGLIGGGIEPIFVGVKGFLLFGLGARMGSFRHFAQRSPSEAPGRANAWREQHLPERIRVCGVTTWPSTPG